jgi:hypothetical protein
MDHINALRDIIPALRDGKDAKFLLEHPRRKQIQLEASGFQFLRPGATKLEPQHGVTRKLKTLFWENWKMPTIKQPKRPPAPPPATMQEAATGKVRGGIIHRQIHDFVTMDKASFDERNPEGLHPWARLILKQLLNLGIYIIATEYAVCDEEMGIATAIDFIGADAEGRIYLFELKTSSSWALFSTPQPATPMTGCLSRLPNSAMNRAMVQLAITSLMLSRSLKFNNFRACVLFLGEWDVAKRQLHIIGVQEDFIAGRGTDAYVQLFEYMTAPPEEDPMDEEEDVGVYF